MSEAKTCSKCKRVLPLSQFYQHVKACDGYHPACKGCMNSDRKASRWRKRSQEIQRKPPEIVAFRCIHDVWPIYPSSVDRPRSESKTFKDLLRRFS